MPLSEAQSEEEISGEAVESTGEGVEAPATELPETAEGLDQFTQQHVQEIQRQGDEVVGRGEIVLAEGAQRLAGGEAELTGEPTEGEEMPAELAVIDQDVNGLTTAATFEMSGMVTYDPGQQQFRAVTEREMAEMIAVGDLVSDLVEEMMETHDEDSFDYEGMKQTLDLTLEAATGELMTKGANVDLISREADTRLQMLCFDRAMENFGKIPGFSLAEDGDFQAAKEGIAEQTGLPAEYVSSGLFGLKIQELARSNNHNDVMTAFREEGYVEQ
ncbi:MAG: hypothetical protein HQ530_00510 [Parcubacteria group bacterium]|nr:hypothetical protein [Parcubacteria group bacterium]